MDAAATEAVVAASAAVEEEAVASVCPPQQPLQTSADSPIGGRTGFQQSTGPPDTVLGLSFSN